MTGQEILIGGFTPFSIIDFPDHFAAIAFLQGCVWRCPFCHNRHLQGCKIENLEEAVSWAYVLDFLEKRKNKLDGLVFSGGEPLMQPAIISAAKEVKELGFDVAIHTGGGKPDLLEQVMPYTDWVGLDIKAPDYLYKSITGGIGKFDDVSKSLDMLLNSGIEFETRTTVFPKFLGEDEIQNIAEFLSNKGVKKYVLQEYRPISNNEEVEKKSNILKNQDFINKISNMFEDFSIRFA